jgi:cell division protein FtsL
MSSALSLVEYTHMQLQLPVRAQQLVLPHATLCNTWHILCLVRYSSG